MGITKISMNIDNLRKLRSVVKQNVHIGLTNINMLDSGINSLVHLNNGKTIDGQITNFNIAKKQLTISYGDKVAKYNFNKLDTANTQTGGSVNNDNNSSDSSSDYTICE